MRFKPFTPTALVLTHSHHFPPDFATYLEENLTVFLAFEGKALALPNIRSHYGADVIRGIIRWHTTVAEKGTGFKFSNNHTPSFARLFHLRHPERPIFILHQTKHERDHGVMPPGWLAPVKPPKPPKEPKK